MPTAAAGIPEDNLPDTYMFTADWFSQFAPIWSKLLAHHAPARLHEIGSYEGRAACFMIEHVASERPMELHCIDTWEGGAEHSAGKMPDVEARFDTNIATARAAAPHPVDFHSPSSPAFWIFWVAMIACFVVGFIPKRKRGHGFDVSPAATPKAE